MSFDDVIRLNRNSLILGIVGRNRLTATILSVAMGVCTLGNAQNASMSDGVVVTGKPGNVSQARLLILEAEDLGMAHSIDSATFKALENGWITSAGVLIPGPWLPEVGRWAQQHKDADFGVRLDVNSDWSSYRWRPVSPQESKSGLVDEGGYLSNSQKYIARHATSEQVERELREQIQLAQRFGISPSHLDNHMRALTTTPALFRSYWEMGQEFKLPILVPKELIRSRGVTTSKPGVMSFGGIELTLREFPVDRELEIMPGLAQKDWLPAYERTLHELPPGVYVLSVHLGFDNDELRGMTWNHPNWGAEWRQNDYDVISSPEFQKFLKDEGFVLVSWKDLNKVRQLN